MTALAVVCIVETLAFAFLGYYGFAFIRATLEAAEEERRELLLLRIATPKTTFSPIEEVTPASLDISDEFDMVGRIYASDEEGE